MKMEFQYHIYHLNKDHIILQIACSNLLAHCRKSEDNNKDKY